MNVFLDTSSLFKLYHFEEGTVEMVNIFQNHVISGVFLSEITKIEFDSVVWKKVRKSEIDTSKASIIIKNFEKDWVKYTFIEDDSELKMKAKKLVSKYGIEGLRTLDSIQLATAIDIKTTTKFYKTADNLLQKLFKLENLPTEIRS